MKNKILIFLGILVASVFGITSVSASNLSNNDYQNYLKRNEKMVELSNRVEQEMLKHSIAYPAYFGGMYIGAEAKSLVLQIVEKNIPEEKSNDFSSYNKIIKMDDAIIIEYVDNSYTKLQNIYEQINDYYKEANYEIARTNFNEYASHYIDVKSNSVVVSVTNNSVKTSLANNEIEKAKLETKFKTNVLDSKVIKFEQGQKMVTESTPIKAGQGITT